MSCHVPSAPRLGFHRSFPWVIICFVLMTHCLPHKEWVSEDMRPIVKEKQRFSSLSSDEIAKQTPKEFLSEVLPNGLRVSLLSQFHSSTVSIRLFYPVGLAHGENREVSHVLEHLMFGASRHHKKGEYARYVDQHGGKIGAFTLADYTVYQTDILPEFHEKVLEQEADRMTNLVFTAEELENEKKIVTEEQNDRVESNVHTKTVGHIFQKIFHGHPYGGNLGELSIPSQVTMESVLSFYKDYYSPFHAHLVIVGPIEPQQELQLVKKYFGPISAQASFPGHVPSVFEWPIPKEIEISQPKNFKSVDFLYPLPGFSFHTFHDDVSLSLMMSMLQNGYEQDVLHQHLVKKRKVASQAGIFIERMKSGGFLQFSATYPAYRRKSTAHQLLKDAIDQLQSMEWLTEDKLRSAKKRALRYMYEMTLSSESLAGNLGIYLLYYGDGRLFFCKKKEIESVTLADVQRVFRTYVLEQTPAKLYLTPETWLP